MKFKVVAMWDGSSLGDKSGMDHFVFPRRKKVMDRARAAINGGLYADKGQTRLEDGDTIVITIRRSAVEEG